MNEKVKKFCNREGLICNWPTKWSLRHEVIKYLSTKFAYNVYYTEKEVNKILNDNHTFNDCNSLRRDLIDTDYLKRNNVGTKYWKGHRNLDQKMESNDIIIIDCQISDKNRLCEINSSLNYLEEWTDTKHTDEYIDKCLLEGDLPPNGHQEFYRFKKIIDKASNQIIGFVELYLGYPLTDTLWISTFYLDRKYQNQGFGHKAFEVIIKNVSYGFKDIALGVHLKNWPALRFWINNGFKEIVGIYGDKYYTPNTFSILSLKKTL